MLWSGIKKSGARIARDEELLECGRCPTHRGENEGRRHGRCWKESAGCHRGQHQFSKSGRKRGNPPIRPLSERLVDPDE